MKQKKRRVLIVDDDQLIRNVIAEFLLRQGLEVGTAENGVEALKIFNYQSFDLVITDIQMPYMDGLDLASEIRKKRPRIIIIMMSGDMQARALTEDVTDYFVTKPFQLEAIYSLMNCALELEA
jgi:two-component system response regulator ResD